MNSTILDAIRESKKSMKNKVLSTDEYAEMVDIIETAAKELENFSLKTGDDYILLKFGTIKGCDIKSKRGKSLLQEYTSIGRSISVMGQKDSQRQKDIIIQLIEECNGSIVSDWSGEVLTKEKATQIKQPQSGLGLHMRGVFIL